MNGAYNQEKLNVAPGENTILEGLYTSIIQSISPWFCIHSGVEVRSRNSAFAHSPIRRRLISSGLSTVVVALVNIQLNTFEVPTSTDDGGVIVVVYGLMKSRGTGSVII